MIQYKRNKEILCITQKLFKVVLEILYNFAVTPCVGVWIEIELEHTFYQPDTVTPCVGVWIEILESKSKCVYLGHSLRGSVD